MTGRLLLAAALAFAQLSPAVAQEAPAHAAAVALDDGPYVFQTSTRRYDAWWVCDGKVEHEAQRKRRKDTTIAPRCGYGRPVVIPSRLADAESVPYTGGRIVALSDIHGQYDLMVRLLRAHRVIDDHDDWALGRDHLVVTGDVFDRGDKVNEVFWLLFQLQQQAYKAGGAMHFLLGNHETMVLYDDLRYINPKYRETARLLDRPYPALYGVDTVTGGWLRTRPVMLKLGDTLFLHGGIAPENLDLAAGIDATNAGYRGSLGRAKDAVKTDPATSRLYDGKRSPIWYRGYFNGELATADVQALVGRLGLARIVVGHTTMDEVVTFHGGRIVAIDSGIKRGVSGQLLFIENGRLTRGLLDGTREALPERRSPPADKD